MGPKMLELTGRYADGALPLCLPPQQVRRALELVAAGASGAGRSMATLDVAACVWLSLDDDRDAARHHLARQIARYSGSLSTDTLAEHGLDPGEFARTQSLMDADREADAVAAVLSSPSMLSLGVVGDVHDVLEQCEAMTSGGVRHLSFGPPLGPSPGRAQHLLAEHVLPRFAA